MDSLLVESIEIKSENRLATLENQELDSPLGQLSVELYSEFLGLYLLTNDLVNAKLLWKRIPTEMKFTNDELKAIWEVGKAAWKHDYADLHNKLSAFEWSDPIKEIMQQYKANVMEHCLNLVAGGYTTIKLEYMASILGLSKDETIDVVTKRGWTCLNQNEIIKPIKNKKEAKYALQNEEHLEKLTRHILYLET